MRTPAEILRDVRDYARGNRSYAWPGGYPVYLHMADGAMLCPDCAKSEYRQISDSTRNRFSDGWQADGLAVYWEGPAECCAHCSKTLESAYGDPEAEDETDA